MFKRVIPRVIFIVLLLSMVQPQTIRICGRRLQLLLNKVCTWPDQTLPCFNQQQRTHSEMESQIGKGVASQCCNNRCEYDSLTKFCCTADDAKTFYAYIGELREEAEAEEANKKKEQTF